MKKKCGEPVTIPLKFTFFFLKDYLPISLLSVFGKISERIINNSLFNHLLSNKLFALCQLGFLAVDSCTAQLLSIIHEIQTAYDNNPTVNIRCFSCHFQSIWQSLAWWSHS